MIKAVRIENLRSLKDTGYIQIKPLTVLLGANSSGKSTFLRSFLLFTQSVNKRLRGPISWFDDSLVDFGDFYTALNSEAKETGKPIRFSFKAEPSMNDRYPRYQIGEYLFPSRVILYKDYEYSFSVTCEDGETYINEVTLKEGDLNIKAQIKSRNSQVSFYIDNEQLKTAEQLKWAYTPYNSILPTFENRNKESEKRPGVKTSEELIEFVKARSRGTLKSEDKILMLFHKSVYNKEELLTNLKTKCAIKSFSNYIEENNWTTESAEFKQLYGYLSLFHFLSFFQAMDVQLTSYYGGCSYIAPARAEANRYYRTQGLQVMDIDPYGRNLQEFIASLDSDQKISYQIFTKNILKVIVDTEAHEGHQSIVLKSEQGEYNMADVGFGYSQILPIITKLWYITNERENTPGRGRNMYYFGPTSGNTNILIEQPELHLHPAYQAKIADAIIEASKKSKKNNKQKNFIVETHSEIFINRLGRRVKEGLIDKDDVNVIVFNKRINDKTTSVNQLSYKQNGQIQDWPYGFFDPDID